MPPNQATPLTEDDLVRYKATLLALLDHGYAARVEAEFRLVALHGCAPGPWIVWTGFLDGAEGLGEQRVPMIIYDQEPLYASPFPNPDVEFFRFSVARSGAPINKKRRVEAPCVPDTVPTLPVVVPPQVPAQDLRLVVAQQMAEPLPQLRQPPQQAQDACNPVTVADILQGTQALAVAVAGWKVGRASDFAFWYCNNLHERILNDDASVAFGWWKGELRDFVEFQVGMVRSDRYKETLEFIKKAIGDWCNVVAITAASFNEMPEQLFDLGQRLMEEMITTLYSIKTSANFAATAAWHEKLATQKSKKTLDYATIWVVRSNNSPKYTQHQNRPQKKGGKGRQQQKPP